MTTYQIMCDEPIALLAPNESHLGVDVPAGKQYTFVFWFR